MSFFQCELGRRSPPLSHAQIGPRNSGPIFDAHSTQVPKFLGHLPQGAPDAICNLAQIRGDSHPLRSRCFSRVEPERYQF
jgi:hypothetical protein